MSTYNQKSRWKDSTKESVIDSINALTARMCKLRKSNIQTTICFLIVLKRQNIYTMGFNQITKPCVLECSDNFIIYNDAENKMTPICASRHEFYEHMKALS